MPLEPACLSFRDDGSPYSDTYGDIYHPGAAAMAQAQRVFLAGNRLPDRWRNRERFTIVETGFGFGLNFLATWSAWRADPARCARLHFVSTELHPFAVRDLESMHARWPALAMLSGELRANWPALTPGFHRIHLDNGAIVLTLLFGDAASALQQLECNADAFYLDGFSPDRNPRMWSAELFSSLARLANRDATLATWSVNPSVIDTLVASGFACEKQAGLAHKRKILAARFAGPARPRETARQRRALVVGAGVAGTSIANRLAERGWSIDLIDAAQGPGQGASGNLAGVLRPLPSLDDNRLARLTRAASLYGVHHLRRLESLGAKVRWDACGVLQIARDPTQETRQRAVVEAHRYPDDYLRFVERDEASAIADWPLEFGGWWFPRGGWIQPPSLCGANLAVWPERIRRRFDTPMHSLQHRDGEWFALDDHGEVIAHAPVAILANGVGIVELEQARAMPVRSARGQVSHLPATPDSSPRVVVCRLGYVSPAVDGMRCAGATFAVDDDDPELRERDHRENLAKLELILPGYCRDLEPSGLAGRVGFRPASPDRLPMVGSVPAAVEAERESRPGDVPRHPGLYAVSGFGARGLVWAALVAEHLASMLDGDPSPLERELADAIDPVRFVIKPARKPRRSAD